MTIRNPNRVVAGFLFALATGVPTSFAKAVDVAAPVIGTGGRWEYDGRRPPSCNDRDRRVRHFEGDGHTTGHEHVGHGHKWSKRNFKGYPTKPPCYVKRVAARDRAASPALLFQSEIASLRENPGAGAQLFRRQQS